MDKISFNILKNYIMDHKISIIGFIIFLGMQSAIYFLYNIRVQPLIYSVYISGLIVLPFFLYDFRKYINIHKQLSGFIENWDGEVFKLDKPNGIISKDYQTLVYKICDYNQMVKAQYHMIELERIDYYTFWTHQIKTPIYSMDIMLQTDEIEIVELKQRLFQITQYVDMALKYLHLENRFSDFTFKNYELRDLVQNTVKKFSSIFISKNIKVSIKNISDVVLTDKKWTMFVLEQILSNALKYSNCGTISIYQPNTNILIIEDEGIGIAGEDLPRIFDKGFTGINGRISQKSSGIGLYLCKKVMGQLGHDISVHSAVGVGTQVILDFSRNSFEVE